MAKTLSKTARDALAATDWKKNDGMTDEDVALQIAVNPNAAPDVVAEIDARAIRRDAGMTQAEFAAAYEFSIRNRAGMGARCHEAERPLADIAARHQGRSRGFAEGSGDRVG